jgi:fumarate hydratase subunit alpha
MGERRVIHTDTVKTVVKDLLYGANFALPPSVDSLFKQMEKGEISELARFALHVLSENARIAESEKIPLCQDCGVVMLFLEIGQDVSIAGGDLYSSITDAVREGHEAFSLRRSVISDPMSRQDAVIGSTPFVHAEIVPGDNLKVILYLKGGGSENMTGLRLFKPTASVDEIIGYIIEWIVAAGPNPCPPLFLGVGIGGTADIAMLNSKKALFRGPGTRHANPFYDEMEARILERANRTGLGPLGFGGVSTVAAVFIKEVPAHIATLPVALNLNCHSFRYREAVI